MTSAWFDQDASNGAAHRFCVAPMLDWTDRHCRYFHRQLSRRARLYTEMVTTAAILHGRRDQLLAYDPHEQPLALQLGGADRKELAACARIGADMGFSEINLNVGCPSDRVQRGRFGACLMLEPETVAAAVKAMSDAVTIPVTVKSRIGVDDQDSYEALAAFIGKVHDAGCRTFIVHARKAWLKGLSPRQNREIPPLRYDMVAKLKRDFESIEIVLNGGIQSMQECREHLRTFDGVMIGRAAYHQPYLLSRVDGELFGDLDPQRSRVDVVNAMLPYIERQISMGQKLHGITRHMLGLFHGEPGGKVWRRRLGEMVQSPGTGAAEVLAALELQQGFQARQPDVSLEL